MLEEEYSHLAGRLVIEQNRARTALCCTSAAAHQGMADAYRARLRLLLLSPASYRAETSLAFRQEWLIAEPTIAKSSTNPAMRVAPCEQGDWV